MEKQSQKIMKQEEHVTFLWEHVVGSIKEYRSAKKYLQKLKDTNVQITKQRSKYKPHTKCPHLRSEHERNYPGKVVRVRSSIIHPDLFPITSLS